MDFRLLKETERINRQRVDILLERLKQSLWVIRDKQVGLLGLAFKPNTDDVRLAPALEVARRLLAEGAIVRATDPVAIPKARHLLPDLRYEDSAYETAKGADALLLLTEWKQFRGLDWKRIRDEMARPLLLDARNMFQPAEMEEMGFEYFSFGRPSRAAVTAVS